MAGRKSPWGGSANGEPGSGEPGSEEQGESAGSGAGSGDEGEGPAPESAPPPRGNGPRNPWLPPSSPEARRGQTLEDLFKRRGGGGGGGNGPGFRLPQRPGGGSWAPIAVGAVALIWLGATMVHRVSPQEKGVVTTFGAYSHTIDSGVSFTLPWPIQAVSVEDVTSIRRDSIPEGDGERLMLTGDQNLVDLTYLVRWNIKDLKLYTFQLAEPGATVKEVAEAAMRQSIAEVTLNDAMGSGRASIESNVRERMQRILDAYRSGVKIQGVEIKKTDPPAKVVDAFKEVLAAQQDAQSDINRAEAYAQQITQRAQGEATSFDKVYAEYKLAPEVTRRRMYYETMERVLSKTDKVIIETSGVMPYLPLPAMKQTPLPEPSATSGERR